jgi:hypothetical protein
MTYFYILTEYIEKRNSLNKYKLISNAIMIFTINCMSPFCILLP